MYYILNTKEQVVGILTNKGKGCPFYDDNHEIKLADSTDEVTNKLIKTWSDTLSLSVPIGYEESNQLLEGNYIVFQDHTGKWKEFTIYEVKETFNNDGHFKTIQAFNSCIWNMSHTRIEKKGWNGANSRDVFSYIFERSGWRIKDTAAFFSGNLKSYEVAEGTAQAALVSAIKDFDVEIQAYVELSNGVIVDHIVELSGTLGRKTALRFEYKRNLNGCERTVSDTNFFTKLYVFGANDANGNPRTISSVNKRKPFILDKSANNKYNGGRKYLEGAITNDKIANPAGLLAWGQEQMKYYNHPHYSYTVDIELLDEDVQIGDSIVVVDREMTPDLQILARVIQTDFSLSDPTKNKVVLGEFIAIDQLTPQLIWQLKAQANQQNDMTKGWSIVIENLGDDDQPNENTKTTTLQAKVYYGYELMNPIIPANAIRWYERNADITADDSRVYKFVGYGFILPDAKYGYEYKAELPDEVKNQIEATLNPITEEDFVLESHLNLDKNQSGLNPKIKADFNTAACQFVEIFEGNYYWLQNYKGKDHKDGKAESYTVTRTGKDGNITGRIKCINSCHGDMFSMRKFSDEEEFTLFSPWYDPKQKIWTLAKVTLTNEDFDNDRVITFDDVEVMFSYKNKMQPRLFRDKCNRYFLVETGRGGNADCISIWDYDVEFEAKGQELDDDSFYQITNFNLTERIDMTNSDILQAVALRYPYLYISTGQGNEEALNDSDLTTAYCYDILSDKVLWKIDFNFKHNIKPPKEDGKWREIETINYAIDEKGETYIYTSFNFEPESNSGQRNEILYKAKEKPVLVGQNNNDDSEEDNSDGTSETNL